MSANDKTTATETFPPPETFWHYGNFGTNPHQLILAGDTVVAVSETDINGFNIVEPERRWKYRTDSRNVVVASDSGKIFFRDGDLNDLVVLDALSGRPYNGDPRQEQRWQGGADGPFLTDPVVVDGVVVVADDDWALRGYDSDSGQLLWQTPALDDTPGPAGLGNGAVFFVAGGVLQGVNTVSGQTRWTFPGKNPGGTQPQAAPAAADAGPATADAGPEAVLEALSAPEVGGGVVLGMGEQVLYALDVRTGALLWSRTCRNPEAHWNTPAISVVNNLVVATTDDGELAVLSLSDGKPAGPAQAPTSIGELAASSTLGTLSASEMGGFLAPKVVHETVVRVLSGKLGVRDLIFVAGAGTRGPLFAIDLQDLSLQWAYAFEKQIFASPVVTNNTVFALAADGKVHAASFATARAGYFATGANAHLSVPAAETYAFPGGAFSVEAWVRTSHGGEILSSLPDEGNQNQTAFRLSLANLAHSPGLNSDGESRLQFGLAGPDGTNVVQSAPTPAADGAWHHLAVVRDPAAPEPVVLYVDGIAQPIAESYVDGDKTLALSGKNGLTIGAFASPPHGELANGYEGLLAEVRLWSVALRQSDVEDKMRKRLRGDETGLVGYWRLDGEDQDPVTNDAHPPGGQGQVAVKQGFKTMMTDLTMDESLFPYLLRNVKDQWPYQGHWSVQGEKAVRTRADAAGEVLVFGTEDRLYAIDAIHGKRKWAIPTSQGTSPAVGNGDVFYVQDGEALVALDPETGEAFWQATPDGDADAPAWPRPATDDAGSAGNEFAPGVGGGVVVGYDPQGKAVWAVDRLRGTTRWKWASPAALQSDFQIGGDYVFFIAGNQVRGIALDSQGTVEEAAVLTYSLSGKQPLLCVVGNRIYAYDGQLTALEVGSAAGASPGLVAQPGWRPPAVAGVTGLAAAPDRNRLVLTTGDGRVLGLEMGSGRQSYSVTLPGDSGVAAGPAVHGRNVYCSHSTSSSGLIVALDVQNGALRGTFATTSPITTAPCVVMGTAFFGCADGSLHSVVFGETNTLKLNPGDAPAAIPVEAMMELDTTNFAVEAWINTQQGGEIISVPPGSEPFPYGFRLWVAEDGSIHLSADTATGRYIGETGATQAADGVWRHVAAVREQANGHDLILIYLDGELQEVTVRSEVGATPPASGTRQILIGADAQGGADGPANAFVGLINQVRLWDTYLHADEVSDRMHVRLRGTEPDLVACWNFDSLGTHDDSYHGYNNPDDVGHRFWLTDLSFVQPTYPSLVAFSHGEGTVEHTSDQGQDLIDAQYTTRITARKGDGTPDTGRKVRIWARETTQVKVNDGVVAKTIDLKKPMEVTTDDRGEVELHLVTKDVHYSPELLLHVEWMYPNEYFHVSPVLESQRRIVIPPPHLVVQSRLLQDYHYAPGDKLGVVPREPFPWADTASYRSIVTAVRADGSVIANESIEVWASQPLAIRSSGQVYVLSPQNSARFQTDEQGQVTLELTEGLDIKMPSLSVRAGFMPRNMRFAFSPDEAAHQTLSTLTGPQLRGNAPVHADDPPETKRALLTPTESLKADAIAQAVRHTMSVTRPAPAPTSVSLVALDLAAVQKPNNSTARIAVSPPVPPPLRGDVIRTAHTVAGVPFHAPITPERMPAQSWVVHFRDDQGNPLDENAVHYEELQGDEDVRRLLSHADGSPIETSSLAPDDRLGSIGSWFENLGKSIVHGVKKAVRVVVNGVKKVISAVKKVINRIEVSIVYLEEGLLKVAKLVVKSVEVALKAVGKFFEAIGKAIMAVIDFIRALFDWTAILSMKDTIKTILGGALDVMGSIVPQIVQPAVDGLFTGLKKDITKAFGAPLPYGSLGGQQQQPGGMVGHAISSVHSAKGKYLGSKANEQPASSFLRGTLPQPAAAFSGVTGLGDGIDRAFQDLWKNVNQIIHQAGGLMSLRPNDLLKILEALALACVDVAEDLVDFVLEAIESAIEAVIGSVEQPLDIPFISALYEFISGSELTWLDLVSLVVAIPTHMAYVFAGKTPPSAQELGSSQSFQNQVGQVLRAGMGGGALLSLAAGEEAKPPLLSSQVVEQYNISFIVFTVVKGIAEAANDAVIGASNMDYSNRVGNEKVGNWQLALRLVTPLVGAGTSFCHGMSRLNLKAPMVEAAPWLSIVESALAFLSAPAQIGFMLRHGRPVDEPAMFKGVPAEYRSTLIGLIFLVYNAVACGLASGDAQMEAVEDILSTFPLILKPFRALPMVADSEGGSLAALALLDVAIYSIAVPAIHGATRM